MRITQGTFSFLPDLTDRQIGAQLKYALDKGWAVGIEYTDDPHPRNTYWEMFGNPMFDIRDAAGIMGELESCRKTFPQHYVKINLLSLVQIHELVFFLLSVLHGEFLKKTS